MTTFAEKVLHWFDQYGRKSLPWQQTADPYRIWISEIMLQQTQVATVIPYYKRFMQHFPNILSLADAEQDDVLKHWSGLGYYSRARNLHHAAQTIRDEYNGQFPQHRADIETLKGIGRSTAAAICSLAYYQREAILDGNVKRVLARYHCVEGWTSKSHVLKQLWQLAEQALPDEALLKSPQQMAHYTQAMMDLGATVCTRRQPTCAECPLKDDCCALHQHHPHDYPHPKPKKTLPEKQTTLLILQTSDHAVLLTKRPPLGIWGGLWSFPEFADQSTLQQWLNQQFSTIETSIPLYQAENVSDQACYTLQALTPIKHTFSHFHLQIQPLLCKIRDPQYDQAITRRMQRVMEDNSQLWYKVHHDFTGGLPQPISYLLDWIRKQPQ